MTLRGRVEPFVATLLLVSALMALPACRSKSESSAKETRTVKLAWDAPLETPSGYRVLVDDVVILDIPPPPLDPACQCLTASVAVPRGPHTVKVVAYNPLGVSPPSAVTVVQ